MKLTLEQWDAKIRPHLRGIENGAEMITRHVNQMMGKPDFETLAHHDLQACETVLAIALERVIRALADFERKKTIA
jgi:hypothetical protein